MKKIQELFLLITLGFLLVSPLLAENNTSFVKIVEDKKTKVITFSTSYGDIEKGSSMASVMGTLGNPQDISTGNNTEIWHYQFDDGNNLVIYFTKGAVTKVEDRQKSDKDR